MNRRQREGAGDADRRRRRALTVRPWRTISSRIAARRRAERHPDPELARALRDQIRDHAVDADRRQPERERREQRQQQHREAPARQRLVDPLRHRPHVVDRQVRIELADLAADRRGQRRRIGRRVRSTTFIAARRELRVREVHRDARVGVERDPA